MTQELTPYVGKEPILMKGGLVHWVSTGTAERVREALSSQSAHSFMKIKELGIIVNTSEVEGVYTMEQYADVCKIKQGMWQCEYRAWHNKGKRECECKNEFFKKQREDKKRRDDAEKDRPTTPAEQEAGRARFRLMNENAALSGEQGSIFRNMYRIGGQRKIRRSTIDAWEEKNGRANLEGLAIEEDIENETRAEALSVLD